MSSLLPSPSELSLLPPGSHVVTGTRRLPSDFLAALAPVVIGGKKIFWIDAGNCFDAYGFSYRCKMLKADPHRILARIKLARAFNLHQLETMVCRSLPKEWRGEPVVLSDPMGLFYEEDVPAAQAKQVLERVVAGLKALPAAWLVLCVERPAPLERAEWPKLLTR